MDAPNQLRVYPFQKKNSAVAILYWNPTDLLNQTYDGATTLWTAKRKGTCHLIDPLNGTAYEIPNENIRKPTSDVLEFLHLPLYDYPLILTIGDFIERERTEQNRTAYPNEKSNTLFVIIFIKILRFLLLLQ